VRERARLAIRLIEQSTAGRWLLIYDAVAEETALFAWIPEMGPDVIVTSQNRAFSGAVRLIQLGRPTSKVARSYLRQASGRGDINDLEWQRLSHVLDNWPLALAQASAFQCENPLAEPSSYRERLSESMRKPPTGWRFPDCVFATFINAMEEINQRHFLAWPVLHVIAFLHPNRIPVSLLRELTPSDLPKQHAQNWKPDEIDAC
jgi:hypothetical protein